MKVSIVRGGGLAGGLVTSTSIDAADLDADGAATLRGKVQAARVVDLPKHATAAANVPDGFSYEIRVQQDGAEHVAYLSDDDMPAPVRELIEWIRRSPARQQRIQPL